MSLYFLGVHLKSIVSLRIKTFSIESRRVRLIISACSRLKQSKSSLRHSTSLRILQPLNKAQSITAINNHIKTLVKSVDFSLSIPKELKGLNIRIFFKTEKTPDQGLAYKRVYRVLFAPVIHYMPERSQGLHCREEPILDVLLKSLHFHNPKIAVIKLPKRELRVDREYGLYNLCNLMYYRLVKSVTEPKII